MNIGRVIVDNFKLAKSVELRHERRVLTTAERSRISSDTIQRILEDQAQPCVYLKTDGSPWAEYHKIFDETEVHAFIALQKVEKEKEYLRRFNQAEYNKLLKYKNRLEAGGAFDEGIYTSVTLRINDFDVWFISNGFEVPEFDESGSEKDQTLFNHRLAGFHLILDMEGFFSHETLRKAMNSASIEQKERKLKRDKGSSVEESVAKMVSSRPQTLYQLAKKDLEGRLYDSIKFTCHGGFRQMKSTDKAEFERRPDFTIHLDKNVVGAETIRQYQDSESDFLRETNEEQYISLLKNRKALEYQLNQFGKESPERRSIDAKLQEIELCQEAFSQWFIENRYEIPKVKVGNVESAETEVSSNSRIRQLEGLRWEEIHIIFVSNDSVKIEARGESERFTFAEMGFKDKRKGDRPDSVWRKFKEVFARNDGNVAWQTDAVKQKDKDNLKTTVKNLRKRLKDFMRIDDDPFDPYRSAKAYKTKFKLTDSTPKDSSDDYDSPDDFTA